MVDDTWNFWDYVDFNTCIVRTYVDEGKVFKTYTEYKRAVADEAAKLVAGNDSTGADEAGNDSTGAVTGVAGNDSAGAVTGALFAKSSKASSKSKSGKASSKAVKLPFQ